MTNTMNKIVNGVKVDLTPEEIVEFNVRQSTTEDLLQEVKDSKIELYVDYLKNTDWYCLRHADAGGAYPQEIKDNRTFARAAINTIDGLTTIEAVEAFAIEEEFSI